MTDEAKPEETPGPYRTIRPKRGFSFVEGPGLRETMPGQVEVYAEHLNVAHAAGVASANERNEAQSEPGMFTVQQMERSVDSAYRQGFAAGIASEKARNEARWGQMRNQIRKASETTADPWPHGYLWVLRIIDEERGKP